MLAGEVMKLTGEWQSQCLVSSSGYSVHCEKLYVSLFVSCVLKVFKGKKKMSPGGFWVVWQTDRAPVESRLSIVANLILKTCHMEIGIASRFHHVILLFMVMCP